MILQIFLLIPFAVRDAFSTTLMSVGETERADERQRHPALLIPLIPPLIFKEKPSLPPPAPPPPPTHKPPLNYIISYFILPFTPSTPHLPSPTLGRGRRGGGGGGRAHRPLGHQLFSPVLFAD